MDFKLIRLILCSVSSYHRIVFISLPKNDKATTKANSLKRLLSWQHPYCTYYVLNAMQVQHHAHDSPFLPINASGFVSKQSYNVVWNSATAYYRWNIVFCIYCVLERIYNECRIRRASHSFYFSQVKLWRLLNDPSYIKVRTSKVLSSNCFFCNYCSYHTLWGKGVCQISMCGKVKLSSGKK